MDIIYQEKCYLRRLIREGFEIKQLGNKNMANLMARYEINKCSNPILKKKLKKTTHHGQEFLMKIVCAHETEISK